MSANKRKLPAKVRRPKIKILWNKVRLSRKPHTLNCGCAIPPNTYYHSTGCLVNGKFAYAKQHLTGCIDRLN